MQEKEEFVELKFRLFDGSEVGPFRYSVASTVAQLKDRIVAEWPQDTKPAPKAANDVKIISAGKFLENGKTIGQCRTPFDELHKGVFTMHALVQPSISKTKTAKKIDESEKKSICSCSIL
ncbi:hypothetical protein RND81_02G164900 [Saponaria officinalis]|uniref:Membrane-anchored ubiquitin-fold protein n=1 Tax=Saponaria officinalis TaxID=3572 RepID=A0AAW1MV06_SAPOF